MEHTMCELFAGIGGFRIAFNHVTLKDNTVQEEPLWTIVFANQWEPKINMQSAFKCYQYRFGKSRRHVNKDINKLNINSIPKHSVLTAGFPCQDFSVANSKNSKGIKGDKGSLLITLLDIIHKKKPPFILLENVDRLLKSPASQRGRDFAFLLKKLSLDGYIIEWRVINASDYGYAQRRRRVFIFAVHSDTKYAQNYLNISDYEDFSFEQSFFSDIFPIQDIISDNNNQIDLQENSLDDIIDNGHYFFDKTGICVGGEIFSTSVVPEYIYPIDLQDILIPGSDDFNLTEKQVKTIQENKGAKSVTRVHKDSQACYTYSEGTVSFPDDLLMPSRTLTTYEGTVNRSAHVVKDPLTQKYRFLSPVECERLQMLPDGWTDILSNRQRYFVIGNSLVIGVVQRMADKLYTIIENED